MRSVRCFLLCISILGAIFPLYAHRRDSLDVQNIEFVANKGQWETDVLYKCCLNAGAFFAEKDAFTFVFLHPQQVKKFHEAKFDPTLIHSPLIDAAAYKVHFVGANPTVNVTGKYPLGSYDNYFIGRDSKKWATQVPKYHEVVYTDIYSNIDLLLTQGEGHLKYEFYLHKGSDVSQIKMHYDGVQNLSLHHGNLMVMTSVMQIVEMKPVAYQIDAKGNYVEVDCNYRLNKREVTFELGAYDPNYTLVIDPVLIFSSYSGSHADNWGYTATFDNDGNLYAGGNIFGIGYPTTVGAFQINFAGGSTDIAISKFRSNGDTLLFSTYLGGSGTEVPHSLVVNANDELYVLGTTSSADFPITIGAFDTVFHGGSYYVLTNTVAFTTGSDIVISKFNSQGTSLLGSTYIGGSSNDGLNTVSTLCKNYADEVRGEIIIDEQSNVYVASCTQSVDFPVTAGVFDTAFAGGVQDGCLIKLNHNLTNMIWCSYIGGTGVDAAYSLVLANDNSIYTCGGTNSTDLLSSASAVQPVYGGGTTDGFVAHINPNGSQLLELTYLGKEGYDQCYLIKNDRYSNPHLFGQTNATDSAWVHNAAWYVLNGGQFLTKLTPSLDSVIWSTAFGTGRIGLDISPTALLVDLCNNIYMSGWGSPSVNRSQGGTAGLPITADAFQTTTDNNDYYFICISDDASQLVYATYFGSPHAYEHVDGGTSRFDNHGRIYQAVCAGCGGYDDFPTTQGAWSQQNNSTNCNIGVIKFDFNLPAVVADFSVPNTICAPVYLQIQNTSQRISDSTTFLWSFGDGTISTLENPTHLFSQSGTYTITLVATDAGSCNFSDTVSHTITVLSNTNSTLQSMGTCHGDFVQIGIAPSGNEGIMYHWSPEIGLSNPTISNPIAHPDVSTTYFLFVTDGVCIDTITQYVLVEELRVDAGNDRVVCAGESTILQPTITGDADRFYWSDDPHFTHYLNTDFSQSSLTVTPSVATTYYLRVEGEYCQSMDSVLVQVSQFTLSAPSPYIICWGDSVQLQVTTSEPGDYVYDWQPSLWVLNGEHSSMPWVNPFQNTFFTVSVTNEYQCTKTAQVEVNIRRHDVVAMIIPASCFGEMDGSISLQVTGGEPPYSYTWSNGSSSSQVVHLASDSYVVTITDAMGCQGIDTFFVAQPMPLSIDLLEMRQVFCNQDCNGLLSVEAHGGTAPYSYFWQHGIADSVAEDLCAGAYTVSVMDAHDCSVSASFDVIDTSFFRMNYLIRPISCVGDCDGAIFLFPNDTEMNYEVRWAHDSTLIQDTLYNLCPGHYETTVSVENGCRYQFFLSVEDKSPLQFVHFYATDPRCFADSNGSIQMTVSGGTPPYHYWVNGIPSSNSITNLPSGVYQIVVEDSSHCRKDTLVQLVQPDPLIVSEQHQVVPCPQQCVGWIDVSAVGGSQPYVYTWNDGFTTPRIDHLCAGTYAVTVTDAHQCQVVIAMYLPDSSTFSQNIVAWADDDTLFVTQSTYLHVTDLGNTFTYQWTPSTGVQSVDSVNTLVTPSHTTTYEVVVTDSFGCTQTDTVRILIRKVICEEPYIFVPNAFSPNNDGVNDVIFVHGDALIQIEWRIYDRWGELVFESFDIHKGWDGKYHGKLCEPAVYDYYVKAVCLGGQPFFKKGNITLLQ